MNEPPGARARVGLTGLTVAEHFRDAEGQDVLLFIDNIFRFTQVSVVAEELLKIVCPQTLNIVCDAMFLSGPSCRQTLRCLLCLVVSHLLSDTNLL